MDNRVTAVSFFLGTTVCATVALQLAPPLRDGLRVALRDCCATAAALLRDRVTASPARPQPNAPRPSTSYSLVCRPQRPAVGDSVPADRRAPRRPSAPRVTLASRRNESQRIAASLSAALRRQARGWSEERRSEAAGRSLRRPEASDGDRSAGRRGRSRRSGCQNSPRGVYRPSLVECVPPVGGVVPAERGTCRRVGRRGVGQRGRSVLARCAGGPSRAGGLCGLKAPGTSPVRNDLSRLVVA
jgi:hypothetical protein